MLLSEYVDLTLTLVNNQTRLVEECGYYVTWTGVLSYYNSVDEYKQGVINEIESAIAEGSIRPNITVEHALELYGL